MPLQLFLQKTKKFLLDTLFPIRCLGCGREDVWLCDQCWLKIETKLEQICPCCEKSITPDGRVCFACKKKYLPDGMLVAVSYRNPIIAKIIHHFKYRSVCNLDEALGKILIRALASASLPLPDAIVPVPLHPRRLRWRGYNQSALLAGYLSYHLTPGWIIPAAENFLSRNKFTLPQMKIKDYSRRKENIKNAFSVSFPDAKKNKRVWLIDDVATTGATIFECAKILKKAGVKEVFAIVVARQEITAKLSV